MKAELQCSDDILSYFQFELLVERLLAIYYSSFRLIMMWNLVVPVLDLCVSAWLYQICNNS